MPILGRSVFISTDGETLSSVISALEHVRDTLGGDEAVSVVGSQLIVSRDYAGEHSKSSNRDSALRASDSARP